MKHVLSLALVLSLGSLVGCGSARQVSRTQYGGTVALQGDRAKAMEDAHRQMASHCGPNNYDIISEGEAVVGSETVQDSAARVREDRSGRGATAHSQTVTSTSDKTEWRVEYQCRGAAAAPAPYPAPAPAPYPAPAPAPYPAPAPAQYPPPPPPAPNAPQ